MHWPGLGYAYVPEVRIVAEENAYERRLEQAGTQARGAVAVGASRWSLSKQTKFSTHLSDIIARASRRTELSVQVRDLRGGNVLFEHRADVPMNPASNQKLLTASAALHVLGPDYIFETEVSVLHNTLYLRGQGDPTLDLDDLREVAALAVERLGGLMGVGITRVVVDDSAFATSGVGPGYSESGPGDVWQAPSGALSLNFNTVAVEVRPGVGGKPPSVHVPLEAKHFVVRNMAKTGGRGRLRVRSYPEDGQTVIEVRGGISRRRGTRVFVRRVADPGLYFGSTFAALLAELGGGTVPAVERGRRAVGARRVVVNQSLPLIDVLDVGLAYSNNMVAEQLLRTLAWRVGEGPGSWATGREVLVRYWAALVASTVPCEVENGAGLSRVGRLSASGIVDLLVAAYDDQAQGPSLLDVLPVAGEPGTLRHRFARYGDRVRAKTGTLRGVSGLSGVLRSKSGEAVLGFSVLTHTREGRVVSARARRRVEDRLVRTMVAAVDAADDVDGGGAPGR